jgi:hypothetical protein
MTRSPLALDDPRHGTTTGYVTPYRCRCDRCRAAWAAWTAQRNSQRRQLLAEGVDVEHGSRSTYGNWGCRCRPCKDAANVYRRDWYARRVKAAVS